MNTARTLLEIAGVPRRIARWEQASLLLIDHQMEYLSGGLLLAGLLPAVAECARLLRLARDAGSPVFHIVHHGRPGGALFDPDGHYVRIIDDLAPVADEAIVVKRLPNAFADTGLDARLAHSGRKELVIAGFATHMCVDATTRAAVDHGYAATVVAAACATRALPNPLGGSDLPAATVHAASLAALADRFATVVASAEAWNA